MYVNAVNYVQFKTVTISFTSKLCISTTVTYHVARTKWTRLYQVMQHRHFALNVYSVLDMCQRSTQHW